MSTKIQWNCWARCSCIIHNVYLLITKFVHNLLCWYSHPSKISKSNGVRAYYPDGAPTPKSVRSSWEFILGRPPCVGGLPTPWKIGTKRRVKWKDKPIKFFLNLLSWMASSQTMILECFSNRSNLTIPMEIVHSLSHLKFDGKGPTIMIGNMILFIQFFLPNRIYCNDAQAKFFTFTLVPF